MITDYKCKYFFFMNVIKYKYFASVFEYILITLSWNENRKVVSVSFVAALMHCWGMGIFIPFVYDVCWPSDYLKAYFP